MNGDMIKRIPDQLLYAGKWIF